MRSRPTKVTATVVGFTLLSSLASGCGSSGPRCGEGYDDPEAAVSALITAARLDTPDLACASLPSGSTSEQIAGGVASYSEFASGSESTTVTFADQGGRLYLYDATVADETIRFQVYSESRGRLFWRKDNFHVVPETYSVTE